MWKSKCFKANTGSRLSPRVWTNIQAGSHTHYELQCFSNLVPPLNAYPGDEFINTIESILFFVTTWWSHDDDLVNFHGQAWSANSHFIPTTPYLSSLTSHHMAPKPYLSSHSCHPIPAVPYLANHTCHAIVEYQISQIKPAAQYGPP